MFSSIANLPRSFALGRFFSSVSDAVKISPGIAHAAITNVDGKVPEFKADNQHQTRQIVIKKHEETTILRRLLQFHLDLPNSLIEKLFRLNKIWAKRADGTRIREVSSKCVLHEGDTVFIRHRFNDTSKQDIENLILFPPIRDEDIEDLQQAILYKDDHILAIEKPPNMAVQGGSKQALHLQRFFEALKFGAPEKPRLVHRLDKKTSGVLVLARSRSAAQKLSSMFQRAADPAQFKLTKPPSVTVFGDVVNDGTSSEDPHDSSLQIEKHYWAILTGAVNNPEGTIDNHLFVPPEYGIDLSDAFSKDLNPPVDTIPSSLKVSITTPNRVSPYFHHTLKRAVTNFQVLQTLGSRGSFVRFSPETGRKHQLRVHAASILKAPILGDTKYGCRSYQVLHRMGWGQVFDFSRASGIKGAMPEGMPMFLHLRRVVIRNYFTEFHGATSPEKRDLIVTAPLPPIWKDVAKVCGLDTNRPY